MAGPARRVANYDRARFLGKRRAVIDRAYRYLTSYYYTFIGVCQLTAALLLLIPRTAFFGALVYFPIILNICVLTYATRFEGTRVATLMLLANLFLLVWDFDRLKHILPRGKTEEHHIVDKTSKFPFWFFGFVFAAVLLVIFINAVMYDMRPGNSRLECTNGCKDSRRPEACLHFCECIFDKGATLNACLDEYHSP